MAAELVRSTDRMKKHKLEQYRGKLSPAEISAGINAAFDNARRLCDDAKALLASGSYPTALSLAALSIEESGKGAVLRGLAVARDEKELSEAWREYRTHVRKNVMWPMRQMVLGGARRLRDFRPLVEKGAEMPYVLDNLKQVGFYTDCLEEGRWAIPSEVIDKELATHIVSTAEFMVPDKHVTPHEVELWIEYMQPVWKQSMEQMEAALVAFQRQLYEEGLAEHDADTMEKFMVDGIVPGEDTRDSSNN